MRNLRKLKVNSNVTFVIWLLEWAANASIYVCWILGRNAWKYFLDVTMFWYYVTLPYVHIMNTSYNKDLVIDNGLTNVLKNAFVVPFKFMMRKVLLDRNMEGQDQKSNYEMKNMEKKLVSSDNHNIESCKDTKTDLFIISKPNFSSFPLQTKNSTSPNVPKNAPCSSSGVHKDTTPTNHNQLARQSLSEPDLEENDLSFEAKCLCNGKIILCHMMENISNEEHYLHYFMQLINYEDTVKSKDKANFELTHIVQSKSVPSKNAKRKNTLQLEEDSSKKSYPTSSISPQILELKSKISGNFVDRMEMRKLLLQYFFINCNDEESYNNYLKELIDFEEKLTEC